jgi:O-antigen/teichoic acid export membrane protein
MLTQSQLSNTNSAANGPSPPVIGGETTGTAVRQVARNIRQNGRTWVTVLCDQLLVSGTSFLTTVFVGRILGKEQLGLYVLAYSLLVVLLEVQNSFIASAYTINSPRLDRHEQARYTGDALILSLLLSGLAATVLLVGSTILPEGFGRRELTPLLSGLALLIAPGLVKEFGRRACFAYFRTKEVLLLDVLGSAIQAGGLLVLMWLGLSTVRNVLWIITGALAASAIAWMVSWRKRMTLTWRGSFNRLSVTWSFGMWVLAGNLAVVIPQQLYPWYLAWLKGPNATGTFAACLGLLAFVNPIVSAIGNYLGPAAANAATHGERELSRVIVHATALVSGVVGLFSGLIVVFGNKLLLLLYGSEFTVDAHLLMVLAAGVFASQCTLALGFAFWAVGRPDLNLKINVVSTFTAAMIGPFAVSAFGLMGAAWGLLAANIAVSAIRVVVLKRVTYRSRIDNARLSR